jgi:hypothetical protein
MESFSWKALSLVSGALAAIAVRKLLGSAWPGANQPPLNPANRRINWTEALVWGVASGIGAGVARVVSKRTAAAAWEKATGKPPPGITPA